MTTRPEERRRSGTAEAPPWLDTLPCCFRSEGFAEDLHEPTPAAPSPAAVRRRRFAFGLGSVFGQAARQQPAG